MHQRWVMYVAAVFILVFAAATYEVKRQPDHRHIGSYVSGFTFDRSSNVSNEQ